MVDKSKKPEDAKHPSETTCYAVDIGDYVLATKYFDGSPMDHFAVGFCAGYFENYASGIRYDIINSTGKPFRGNGFRRAEKITVDEGTRLLKLFSKIGGKPGKSLWWHLARLRGIINPYDSCEYSDKKA